MEFVNDELSITDLGGGYHLVIKETIAHNSVGIGLVASNFSELNGISIVPLRKPFRANIYILPIAARHWLGQVSSIRPYKGHGIHSNI